jgi:hypothetical protein
VWVKFVLRVSLPVELAGVLWPTELFDGLWSAKDRLPRALGLAERDIAGLALI